MFIKRDNAASKSKSIKFDIKICLFPERKKVSINYICVIHGLLNVFTQSQELFLMTMVFMKGKVIPF